MKFILSCLVLPLSIALLSGCGKKEEEEEGKSEKILKKLDGSWRACIKESDKYSLLSTLVIKQDKTLTANIHYFKDADCTTPESDDQYHTDGTFELSEPNDAGISNFNITYKSVGAGGGDLNFFQILRLDEAADKIYVGAETEELDGSTAEKRPLDLDMNYPYSRI